MQHGIESGAVAAAGQYPDSFRGHQKVLKVPLVQIDKEEIHRLRHFGTS
jgi:hypothetical protein